MADRRRFLRSGAMTMAAARLGALGPPSPLRGFGETGTAEAQSREPRELVAIGRATEWLNSPRLAAAQLLGKVVVVNFCTYTCINWLRTLPYVRAWAQKYRQGLVMIGAHTPEFPFEQNLENVRRAIQQMKIEYPIVIDNDYSIWRAFKNQYWPALYFLDVRGRIREHHFGEGEYEKSERAIQRLLAEEGVGGAGGGIVSVEGTGIEAAPDWNNLRSPENYLGHQRTENFASPGGAEPERRQRFSAPQRLVLNQWALVGDWTMGRQAIASGVPDARIISRFHARDLHIVMGPSRPGSPVRFRATLDGRAPGPAHGGDVDEGGNGTVVDQRLYQLIRQPGAIDDRQFEIEFLEAGVEAFAFTFG
jgi:hypothetical protein